ncbi:hypothetical protein QE152_g28556 [Popillia japonica]|uniref:Transposase n=1 Tax=Popillia japonica TaxID=7064 RepID=A0AAW1JJM3_POPJA
MPRVYKKTPGSRSYKNYSDETLDQCLREVLDGQISTTAAVKKYRISKGTIINKIHGRKGFKTGGQTALSSSEELAFVNNLITCAEWGFPLTKHDLRLLVKHYLDREGKVVKQFKNNFPVEEWAISFMKRHKNTLSHRLANNIKRSRAAVDRSMLGAFHDELSRSLEEEGNDIGNSSCVSETFLQYLQEQRNPNKRIIVSQTRKKLNIVPGRSVAADDSPAKNEDATSITAIKAVKRKIMQETSSDSSSDSEVDEQADDECNAFEEETFRDLPTEEIVVESWVLVKYETKKSCKHFIGQVLSLSKDGLHIKFLKKTVGEKFVWPEVEDTDIIGYNCVVKILPTPKIERRGHYS